MKKVLVSFIALFFLGILMTEAQINAGKIVLGSSTTIGFIGTPNAFMNFGFTSTKGKSDDYTDEDPDKQIGFNLMPKAGYFIIDNLSVGLDLFWNFAGAKSGDSDDKSNSTVILVGPFVKYYIPVGKIMPFIEADASFGSIIIKEEYSGNEDKFKQRALTYSGKVGLAVPLGEKVLFETAILYNYMSTKPTENNDNNYRAIYNTFGVNLGFVVLL